MIVEAVADSKKVVVFALGGTIASTPSSASASGITPALGVSALLASLPPFDASIAVEGVDFRKMPSGDLTFDDLVSLGDALNAAFDRGAHGAVVIQGTDTLEETAFALDLLVAHRGTVAVTGAMRSSNEAGHDGPSNVLSAVRVAAAETSWQPGTVVVFNDEIHAARYVHKGHATSPATFVSPSAGPLGWAIEGRVRWTSRVSPLVGVRVPATSRPGPVALVRCALGDDARLIEQLASLGYVGVVVEAFGAGHVPARIVDALEALNHEVPVVITTRTGAGETLRHTYGFPGAEIDLQSRGLTFAGVLDGLKARVALTVVLAAYPDRARAMDAFGAIVASVTE
ncbi:MAG TPA: asparaginase [Acidimicrobiales bacterium]